MTDTLTTTTTTSTPPAPPPADPAATEAFVERLFGSFIAGMEMLSVQLGTELGLYRALDTAGWCTPAEFATAAGIHERYAREWLEQQAVAGILEAAEPAGDAPTASGADDAAARRRFRLPPAHREVLVDEDSPNYLAPGAGFVSAIAQVMPQVTTAFRAGGGVGYAAYGSQVAHGIAQLNGASYRAELASTWLPSIPTVDAALRRPQARVLDLGCGHGLTALEIARGYPRVSVTGLDLDADSVQVARAAAGRAGLADRVTFAIGDAAQLAPQEGYDVVTIFDALHDMGDPVGALRAARQVLRPQGHVLVVDERVAESFTAPGDEVERFCFAASVLHCLPATMAESPAEANGTALRPATMARWSHQAGFTHLEQLPIESVFFRFYLLAP